ncbi:M4 family metallopeptidase [Pseudoalteromonas sp. DL2-H2.2]|uniref:M4 family metallopeptidase n=1 Tax=Pseudoalteromonas sp. DL2-H2.2 TaxID=2908889 RepID=UPI001F3F08BE|nr:M4 family metallopeptidase [Pseudoalteromonas sp. DL2-H2.2]MCF2907860.1 M4 family metallopeptidase [Pseudoalteromonas sp. DL2-H2.2]
MKLSTLYSLVCVAGCLSTQSIAATSLRATQQNQDEVLKFLEQKRGIQSSDALHFAPLTLSHQRNINNNKSKRYQQYFGEVPVWGHQLSYREQYRHVSGFFASDLDPKQVAASANTQFDVAKAAKQLMAANKLADSEYAVQENTRYVYIDNDQAFYVRQILLSAEPHSHAMPVALFRESDYQIVKQWDNVKHATATGPGGNVKVGQYEYGVDYPALDITQSGDTCYLENDKVKTVSLESGYEPQTAFSFACSRNTHKEVNGAYSPLNDAHAFGTAVFDMYEQWFDMPPLTFKLLMRVHADYVGDNATWNGSAMTFGDGIDRFHPLVSLDIVSHEVSHGFTQQNSDLIYEGQSGGINEAFSDIAGEAAEYFLRGTNDWLVGADITKQTTALRYFETPSRDGVSIDHADDFTTWMDVHYSSGVFNRAFYLLATSEGWDVRQAFSVMVHANRHYWVNSSDFIDGACGVINAAIELNYPSYPVIEAFAQVGLSCDNILFSDIDGDGMDDNWEVAFGLNPDDREDALTDLDGDGLNNLQEYKLLTRPDLIDTDEDTLSDYAEVFELRLDPLSADTDKDAMPDSWENQYGLDPTSKRDAFYDADGDGQPNLAEFQNGTDPTDASSAGEAEVTLVTLELGQTPPEISFPDGQAAWLVTDSVGFTALTNPDITDSQITRFSLELDSAQHQGILSFDYKVSSEASFDFFNVYLNDQQILSKSGNLGWQTHEVVLPSSGQHTFIFEYQKDGSVSIGDDAVFITNILLNTGFKDTDQDGLYDLWEIDNRHDPFVADAHLDLDGDGLTGHAEFDAGTYTWIADSDGDGVQDGTELALGWDPMNSLERYRDSDGDGYTDADEVQHGADPNDAASVPKSQDPLLTSSFEGAELPFWFNNAEHSAIAWTRVSTEASDGEYALQSGDIDDNQESSFTVTGEFESGILNFDLKMDTESCCDRFIVDIDGAAVLQASDVSQWQTHSVRVNAGNHTITFRYRKDGSVSDGQDAVWLDNFVWLSNRDADSDQDGMTDVWETYHGFDIYDASDAQRDEDGDGLSNLQELELGTNPLSRDTDGDGVPDSEDAAPFDPATGDFTAPAIEHSAAVVVEATGSLTDIAELVEVSATDNGPAAPLVYLADSTPLPLGEHVVTWRAIDTMGMVAESLQQVTVVDTTAPAYQEQQLLVKSATATGILAAVSDAELFVDLVSGVNIEYAHDYTFVTGQQNIEFVATDSNGNSITQSVPVSVLPRLTVQSSFTQDSHGDAAVLVQLDGKSPQQTITLSGMVDDTPFSFTSKSYPSFVMPLRSLAATAGAQLQVTDVDGAWLDGEVVSTLAVQTESNAPTVRLFATQAGKTVAALQPEAERPAFYVNIAEPVSTQNYNVEVRDQDGRFWPLSDKDTAQWVFGAPSLSELEQIQLSVTVTNRRDQSQYDYQQTYPVVATVLSKDSDSDGDGVNDAVEGLTDSDGDGIVDYLDNHNQADLAHLNSGQTLQFDTQGAKFTVGHIAQSRTSQPRSDMSLSFSELGGYLAAQSLTFSADDPHFKPYSELFNTQVYLAQGTSSATVVWSHPQAFKSEQSTQIRQLTLQGWETIASESATSDTCAQCTAYTLVDGGPFDLDGSVNGVIESVSVLATENPNREPTLVLNVPQMMEELTSVTLDASASSDLDGDELRFEWRVSEPVIELAHEQGAAEATLTIPELAGSMKGYIEVVIDDGYERFAHSFEVTFVHVNKAPTVTVNERATANSGSKVTLTASASDPDGTSLSYAWQQISGTKVTLADAQSPTLSFTAPQVDSTTELVFKLNVSDGETNTEQVVTVIVNKVEEQGSGGTLLYMLAGLLLLGARRMQKRVK